MTTRTTSEVETWDRRQWASSDEVRRAPSVAHWSLWEWVGELPPTSMTQPGDGGSGLSGFGHNPSGQHWADQAPRHTR
jgi:hypothetical protein